MTLSRKDVERIAQLAALQVDEAALPKLTEQIARIIEYVSQLEAAVPRSEGSAESVWLGRDPPQPLRPDQVHPADLARDLKSFAPAVKEGFFVVPRLAAMEDE